MVNGHAASQLFVIKFAPYTSGRGLTTWAGSAVAIKLKFLSYLSFSLFIFLSDKSVYVKGLVHKARSDSSYKFSRDCHNRSGLASS